MRPRFLPSILVAILAHPAAAGAADTTVAGTAMATAPSSTWIAYEVPFTGDDDRDGWTLVELGLAAGGPFDLGTSKMPGPPEWRADSFRGLTADTDYYLQVTFIDPDGVSGTNPQILGPIHTLASAPNAVTLGAATAEVRDTELYVSLPISDDANGNSYGIVEIATDAGGPWTERCGSPSENRLPYHPKRCRLRSLTPGTDYWVRVDTTDPDGISGTDPQVLGPITYTGRANLAAGRPITADPGWGCCPNPAQLVDGRIQYRFWPYGFAWTGGTSGYGGGPPGWKQATIDLGAPTTFDRVEMWLHGGNSPPIDWRVETSDDGASWTEAWSTTDPQCRGVTEQLHGTSWGHPACSQGALFAPVTARYMRYWFDDRTLFGGLHGWAVELEVFGMPPEDLVPPTDPTAIASTSHAPNVWSASTEITVEWSGAADSGGSGLAGYSVLVDTSPSSLPDDTVDVAHAADPHSTTSASLADGQEHYFHLRTCDNAGNCTATVHLGPYWIDATDAVDPTDVVSTSHVVGEPSSLSVLTMTWTPGSDALSGVDGYAWDVTGSSTPACDEGKDLEETAVGVSGGFLADGGWWFHICTVDNAGNWTSTVTAGPYVVDTTLPTDPTTIESTTHSPSVWSRETQVTMQWSDASDAGGLAGYSVAFDGQAAHTTPHVFQLQWGSNGTGAGEFRETAGIGVDADGNVYVVDHQNRVQVFDADGVFLRMWGWGVDTGAAALEVCDIASLPCQIGIGGAGAGQLDRPVGLAVSGSGHVYVIDTQNSRVQKYDLGGGLVAGWGSAGAGAGQLTQPHGVAVDSAGKVYVAESQAHRIQVFDAAGGFVRMWGWGVDTGAAALEVCDTTSLPCQAGVAGGAEGQLNVPEGVAVAASGGVYVTDLLNQRVQLFTSAGSFVRTWGWGVDTGAAQFEICDTTSLPCQAGIAGGGDGQFDSPEYLDLDASGSAYVSGGAGHRLQKFDNAGAYLSQWGSFGAGSGEFNGPLGVVIGSANSVYVADWANHRIQRFSDPTLPDETIDVPHTTDPHSTTSSALSEGQDHWFHLRTCDQAGHCTTTVHAGPYWIDTTDPFDPTDVQSTSHAVGVASSLNSIAMAWTAGSDASSGLDGYAFVFNNAATPVCDETKDLEEAATGVSSAPVATGSWWFHLCTVDNAGNWTSTVTAGPYVIDTSPPSDPTTVQSTSHTVSTWSNANQVTVEWSGAADSGSAGLVGYSVLFDTSPTTTPDDTVDVAHTSDPHSTTSAALGEGNSHWFHLRTCDGAGNCTSTVHVGPFWIDTSPPEVVLVGSVADTGDGVLSEDESSNVPITQLTVTFDEEVAGAAAATNYLVVSDSGDGFQTTDCATGPDAGDATIPINLASYVAATRTAALDVNGGVPLVDGAYRLLVCGSTSVTDPAGNPLDGNGDGTGGDDFVRNFTLADTRPTAHPGDDRTIDVDQSIALGDFPAASGGTPPYSYLWTVIPDPGVDLSSQTEANPALSCSQPALLSAELVVTDSSSLESEPAAAEITVVCPARRDLFNADLYESHVYEATETITAEKVRIVAGTDITFKAGELVILLDGFVAEEGATFRIVIDSTTDCL